MKLMTSKLIILSVSYLLAFLPLHVSAATIVPRRSLLTYPPPMEIYVRFWHLTQSGAKAIPEIQCASGHDAFGCVAYSGIGYFYPYNHNPELVSVENDYLLDVVPRELDPRFYHSVAEMAEAVASRSYAYYWNFKGWILGNDSSYQVFVPYTFEQWLDFNQPDNPNTPCQSTNLNQAQQLVCKAVSPRYYISFYGDEPAQAEFTTDVYNATVTDTGPEYSPYIRSVQDPISTACDANNFGPLMGMSQEGASRWARGHECSYNNAPVFGGNAVGSIWSIQWWRPEQILFHYYTGVQLRDANNNNAILSPNYRWNPLQIKGIPNSPYSGSIYMLNVQVQNVGDIDLTCSPPYVTYSLRYRWSKEGHSEIEGADTISLCGLQKGSSQLNSLNLQIPNWGRGAYSLRFDVYAV